MSTKTMRRRVPSMFEYLLKEKVDFCLHTSCKIDRVAQKEIIKRKCVTLDAFIISPIFSIFVNILLTSHERISNV